jgi:hypothetical protein
MSEPIPPSLAQFKHYFDTDRIEWAQVEPGWGVVLEAHDTQTNDLGCIGFQVVDKEKRQNGLHDVWIELDDTAYHFVADSEDRSNLVLPKGTLMKAGVSCEHFPHTNAYMSYLGGVAVGRDFSFTEVQAPDRGIIGGVLIAKVQAVHAFLPEGTYTAPVAYKPYREAVSNAKDAEQADYDAWAANLDSEIAKCLEEYYPDEAERTAIQEIISTFHPEGRYKLAVLIEYASEDGVLDKFLQVLQDTLKEEFSYMHPKVRGIDILPASQRGWLKMVRDLGLRNPRPAQS